MTKAKATTLPKAFEGGADADAFRLGNGRGEGEGLAMPLPRGGKVVATDANGVPERKDRREFLLKEKRWIRHLNHIWADKRGDAFDVFLRRVLGENRHDAFHRSRDAVRPAGSAVVSPCLRLPLCPHSKKSPFLRRQAARRPRRAYQ